MFVFGTLCLHPPLRLSCLRCICVRLSDAWMIVSPSLPDCFVFVFVCCICLYVFGLCS